MPYRVVVINEQWQPVRNAVLEVYDADDGAILDQQETDAGGIATFESLIPGRFYFRPRVTRRSGVFDEKSFGGVLNVMPLTNTIDGDYVMVSTNPDLSNERVLTGSSSILITDNGAGSSIELSVIASGIDHGGLGGLADDDHTQYLLLAGRGAEQDVVGGITISTYARIGSNASPTNTAAGDLTCTRLFITDAALNSEARIFQLSDTYTPGTGAFNSGYFLTNATPGAGAAADEIRAFKAEVNVRPTAAYAGAATGFYAEADHDSGAFNVTTLRGGLVQAVQNVAATTVTLAIGGQFVVRPSAGTISDGRGLRITMSETGDAATLTNSYGIEIRANGTPTVSEWRGLYLRGFTTALTVTTARGILIENPTAGTITTHLGIDIQKLTQASTNIEFRNAGRMVYTPTAHAQITAAATAIVVSATAMTLTADAPYVLTATPTIADGQNGQVVTLINVDSNALDIITLQDETGLAGSNLRLAGGVACALGIRDTITLIFLSALGDWVEISRSNN